MKTKDLIKKLEELVAEHEVVKDMMGEHEIVIDVFTKKVVYDVFDNVTDSYFVYAGFSPDIKIEKSSDGVYDILSAFETT